MNTITLTGIISREYCDDSFYKIKLKQQDGFKIDLVGRFIEVLDSFRGSEIQVSYYLSSTPCTKNDLVAQILHNISGGLKAEYDKNEYSYSSWTQGTDYDTYLQVGGHDLYEELSSEEGKFIILEINIKK